MVSGLSSLTLRILVGCCLVVAATNARVSNSPIFTLADGDYAMKATYKLSDQEEPVVNAGGTVAVLVKDEEISIRVPIRPAPIVAKLSGNNFKGQLLDAGVRV